MTQSLTESKRLMPLKAKQLKGNKTTAVHSLAMKTQLPIMFVVSRYDLPDNSDVLWSVLITWQTSIIKSLPKSNFIDSALIDSKGDIFSSNNLLLMTTKNKFSGEKITAAANYARKLSDVVEEYQSNKERKVVGYARSPIYGLAVLVEEDFDRVYAEMNNSRIRTVPWAMLFILFAAMLAYVSSRGTLKSVEEVRQAIRRIGEGSFDDHVVLSSNDEISAVASDLNSMGSDIAKRMKINTAQAVEELEAVTAKTMQTNFFPKKNILSKNLRVSGFYKPSSKCGGDLWGHYEVQDDLHLLYIADAMGVGVQAAIVAAMSYAVSATISRLATEKNTQLEKPSDVLRHVNSIVWDAFQGGISLTFFCAIVDTKNGKMTYANAGHNFPFIIPLKAKDSRSTTKPPPGIENKPYPFSIRMTGNPLGMQKLATYSDKEMTIEAGDKIFLFSDGLIECSSPQGEVWGRKHLFNQLSEITSLPFDEFKDEILSRAFSFFANKPLEDDVTVVVAEVPKAWKSQKVVRKISRRPSVPLPIPGEISPTPIPKNLPEPVTLTAEDGPPEVRQSTPEFAIMDEAVDQTPTTPASLEHIVGLVESELKVLGIEVGIDKEAKLNEATQPEMQLFVEKVPSEEKPIILAVSQQIPTTESSPVEAPPFQMTFSLDLDNSAQEITTAAAFPSAPIDPVPTEKRVRKSKYKVRLPKTG
jgi:serine phosphatase RsbU (regulator of sigma subunit)